MEITEALETTAENKATGIPRTTETTYRVKEDYYITELARAIASSRPDKWGWIIVSDDKTQLQKGLQANKAARHVKGKLEHDEELRVFFRGKRAIKAQSICQGDHEDWYILADPLELPERWLLEKIQKGRIPDPDYNFALYTELEHKGYIGTKTWMGLPCRAWLTEKGKAYLETIKP